MLRSPTNRPDPHTLALQALAWALADEARARRLLDLTGLQPGDLRSRAGDPAVLGAVLGFVEAHEPDLLACAEALDVEPGDLVSARVQLGGEELT